MYNKQKEIEALEKRQALSKVQQEQESTAGPTGSAAQREQLHAANAVANGGLYRAPSPAAGAPASAPAAPLDPVAEVQRPCPERYFWHEGGCILGNVVCEIPSCKSRWKMRCSCG